MKFKALSSMSSKEREGKEGGKGEQSRGEKTGGKGRGERKGERKKEREGRKEKKNLEMPSIKDTEQIIWRRDFQKDFKNSMW